MRTFPERVYSHELFKRSVFVFKEKSSKPVLKFSFFVFIMTDNFFLLVHLVIICICLNLSPECRKNVFFYYYKQWVTADRYNFIEKSKSTEEFFNSLTNRIVKQS